MQYLELTVLLTKLSVPKETSFADAAKTGTVVNAFCFAVAARGTGYAAEDFVVNRSICNMFFLWCKLVISVVSYVFQTQARLKKLFPSIKAMPFGKSIVANKLGI